MTDTITRELVPEDERMSHTDRLFGLHFPLLLEPFIYAIFELPDYRKFALMMERRENVSKLITMIEMANQEQKTARKETRGSKEGKTGRRWLWRGSRWS